VAYRITDEALAAYRRDGYTVIDHLIPALETARLGEILLNLHEKRIGFDEGALFDAEGLDDGADQRFPQILNPRLFAPELEKSEYFRVGSSIAKQILGETARLRVDITFLKPPHVGSPTRWHQDIAFGNPMYDWNQLTIWLALTPADATNSCMSFVPGSHNLPVLDHRPVGGDPRIHALECVAYFDQSRVVECPLSPGGCTIHDVRTLHYSGPNNSDRVRLAYALVFDTTPVLRRVPYNFPWREHRNMTARASRERRWRRGSGFFIYAWRQLRQFHLRGIADLERIKSAIIATIRGR
jgi:ectoine hydroxylase-related dioxygenase (phytanoyl-CoA dioxygenase family)